MRIVVFTVDHREYSPMATAPLIARRKGDIVKVLVSRSLFDLRFLINKMGFFVRNRYPFCIKAGDLYRFVKWKISERRHYPPTLNYYRWIGLDAEYIDDLKDPATLDRLKALNADIFLFALFDKIAPAAVLDIPRLGTYNLHPGLLPEYRGRQSSFWALRDGWPVAGATLHVATEKLDDGDIVSEVRFPVQTRSMKLLMDETILRAATMMADGVDLIERGNAPPISKEGRKAKYLSLPTASDFKKFYARNCRLI
ncbi:MAG TPA: formyltransferase family protein [Prosthecobacter sp.]|nr:formyltransferase family protein [Prosthecobacter sp.]